MHGHLDNVLCGGPNEAVLRDEGATAPRPIRREPELRRLGALPAGAQGRVAQVDGADPQLVLRLAAFGLSPGASVRVLQTFPVLVVCCEETELAIEPDLARAVLVEVDAPVR